MRLFHKVSFRKDPYNFKLSNIIKQNILQELFQQHIFRSFFVDKNNNLPLFIPYGKGVHETAREAQFGGPSECKGTPWRRLNIGYEGISKSFEPNMESARNLDLFCFIFQRSPLPTPHTCPI